METTSQTGTQGRVEEGELREQVREMNRRLLDLCERTRETRRIQEDLREEMKALRAEPELRLHSRAETADLFGISETKLDDLADRGRIRPVKIGRRVFYDATEIHGFIRRCREGSGDE